MAKQKLKQKKKYRKFFEVCKETAKAINGTYREMTNKMWEIGKVIAEKRKEINPKYASGFLAGIANEMKEDVTPQTLGRCERFYNKFPDLYMRMDKSGLAATHYRIMSERDLSEKEIEHYEERASKEDWSTRELTERLPHKIEIPTPESLEAYNDFTSALTELESSFARLRKAKVRGILSQNQINGLARSTWVFVRMQLPRIVIWLERHDAKIDPNMKRYVRKFK